MAGTKADAEAFAKRWAGRGDETQEGRSYWIDLFQNVLGAEDAIERLKFEVPVHTDSGSSHAGYIDVLIPSASALVEMKGRDIDLDKKEVRQGREVTPAEQGRGYAVGLPLNQQPRYVIACNFREIRVYDRNANPLCTGDEYLSLELEELPKNLPALQFLKGSGEAPRSVQRAVSIEAGRIMGKIHNEIAGLYHDPDSEESHHALSVLCTRLMFLMFCEDAGLIEPGLFREYIASVDGAHLRGALIELFAWLDIDDEARKHEYPSDLLARFPYMNGGLFRERVQIPQLNDKVHYEILVNGCQEFDWSSVDPTVFGSIFEGALSHDTRRSGGMHYTSPENIHKVIDPLFLDELKAEFERATSKENAAARKRALEAFHDKIGGLTFLDPACGSGNFLTETYICLRRIENDVLIELQRLEASRKYEVAAGQMGMDFSLAGTGDDLVKVSLANFHGIEVNDFACCVARTALWIAEKQADINTAKVVKRIYDELPLKEYGTIVKANALQLDWNEVVPASECDYIMGNPPFIGHQWRTLSQQEDMANVFSGVKKCGKLDYVCAWYELAAKYSEGMQTECAFVSTNSICQGESVPILWDHLFGMGIEIQFAHKSFVWDSQTTDQAHVHCVIVGFGWRKPHVGSRVKKLFSGEGVSAASNINGYLIDGPSISVRSRGKSINPGAPVMTKGSQPTDGGNLIMSYEEGEELKERYPMVAKWIRQYVGAREFLNGSPRACFYLRDADPAAVAKCEPLLARIRAVRDVRMQSPTESVRAFADRPMEFTQDRQPDTNFLVLPKTTSGRRKYVPIGFLTPEIVVSDKLHIIPDATLSLFGILESTMHQCWIRAVSGRLKSDYEYAPAVYNSFALPELTDSHRVEIESCAQAVLNARARYKDSTLADMYNPDNDFLYPALTKAHRALDAAVEAAYGVDFNGDEEKIVAHLFKLYAEKVGE